MNHENEVTVKIKHTHITFLTQNLHLFEIKYLILGTDQMMKTHDEKPTMNTE